MSGSDLLNISVIILSVLGTLFPAVWFLSAKIQGLSGEVRANRIHIDGRINGLEQIMGIERGMLKEAMTHQDDLRERLAITEVHVEDLRKKIS